jgi:hypothetical protein
MAALPALYGPGRINQHSLTVETKRLQLRLQERIHRDWDDLALVGHERILWRVVAVRGSAFRASWTKHAIQGINRSPHREALRREIGAAHLETIRLSSSLEWLPMAVHLSVGAAVHQVLGIERARSFWKERLLAAFSTKLIAPFVAGASVVYGQQPYALLKMAIQTYKLVTHDIGGFAVSASSDGSVALRFDLEPTVAKSPGWHALCYGQCQGVLEYLKMAGDVSVTHVGAHSFLYVVRRH